MTRYEPQRARLPAVLKVVAACLGLLAAYLLVELYGNRPEILPYQGLTGTARQRTKYCKNKPLLYH